MKQVCSMVQIKQGKLFIFYDELWPVSQVFYHWYVTRHYLQALLSHAFIESYIINTCVHSWPTIDLYVHFLQCSGRNNYQFYESVLMQVDYSSSLAWMLPRSHPFFLKSLLTQGYSVQRVKAHSYTYTQIPKPINGMFYPLTRVHRQKITLYLMFLNGNENAIFLQKNFLLCVSWNCWGQCSYKCSTWSLMLHL